MGTPGDAACRPAAVSVAGREVTARQVEVLAAIVASGSHKEAAFALGISPNTVRNHLVTMRDQLGVSTTAQAIYVLAARGVLVVPSVGRHVA